MSLDLIGVVFGFAKQCAAEAPNEARGWPPPPDFRWALRRARLFGVAGMGPGLRNGRARGGRARSGCAALRGLQVQPLGARQGKVW